MNIRKIKTYGKICKDLTDARGGLKIGKLPSQKEPGKTVYSIWKKNEGGDPLGKDRGHDVAGQNQAISQKNIFPGKERRRLVRSFP